MPVGLGTHTKFSGGLSSSPSSSSSDDPARDGGSPLAAKAPAVCGGPSTGTGTGPPAHAQHAVTATMPAASGRGSVKVSAKHVLPYYQGHDGIPVTR
jgi:hypothetical protein